MSEQALTCMSKADLAEVLDSGGFPKFKIYFPVEATKYTGKVCIVGDNITEMTAPYHIGVVAARAILREDYVELGKKKKRLVYKGGATAEKYQTLYDGAAPFTDRGVGSKNEKVSKGIGALILIFTEGKAQLCTAEITKTQESYWRKVFNQAQVNDGCVVRVDLTDHMENLVESKADSSLKYFAPWLFKEWAQEEMTPEQKELAKIVLSDKTAQIEEWLNK